MQMYQNMTNQNPTIQINSMRGIVQMNIQMKAHWPVNFFKEQSKLMPRGEIDLGNCDLLLLSLVLLGGTSAGAAGTQRLVWLLLASARKLGMIIDEHD